VLQAPTVECIQYSIAIRAMSAGRRSIVRSCHGCTDWTGKWMLEEPQEMSLRTREHSMCSEGTSHTWGSQVFASFTSRMAGPGLTCKSKGGRRQDWQQQRFNSLLWTPLDDCIGRIAVLSFVLRFWSETRYCRTISGRILLRHCCADPAIDYFTSSTTAQTTRIVIA